MFLNFTNADHFRFNLSPRKSFNKVTAERETKKSEGIFLTFIDTDQERKIDIGSNTYLYSKMKPSECLIHTTLAVNLNLEIGDSILLHIDIQNMYKTLILNFNKQSINNQMTISNKLYNETNLTCTVAHIVEGSLGKYGEQDAEETIIMELEWLLASINMPRQITEQ